MDGLTEGRIVHFVLPNGEHRPAIIVRVWSKETGCVNLQVFTDSTNDGLDPVEWRTSVSPSQDGKEPYTWHWIEKA